MWAKNREAGRHRPSLGCPGPLTAEAVLWLLELVVQLEAVIRLPRVVAADAAGQKSIDMYGLVTVHLYIQSLR